MRIVLTFLATLSLITTPVLAQTCPAILAAPRIIATAPVVAAPRPNVTSPLTAAPLFATGCDIEPAAGPTDPTPTQPPPPPPPANCPAQTVSWKVLLLTYSGPLAALNHGQTGRATQNVLFVGLCSADFTCTNGTISQTGAGFCL